MSLTEPTADRQGSGAKPWQPYLVVGLVLVVLVLLVNFLGGFNQRTSQKIIVPAGTIVELGVADVRVLSAAARESTFTPDSWTITVQAEVRVTERPVSGTAFRSAILFGYTNKLGAHITKESNMMIMDQLDLTRYSPRMIIPPGNQLVRVQFYLPLTDGLTVDQPLSVGLIPVRYSHATDLVGRDQGDRWITDDSAGQYWVVELPIRTG